MDSGNSGSLQSSSGGDEDYDSRTTESISSFLNPSFHFSQINNPQQQHHHPPPPHLSLHQNPQQQQLPPTFFDPLNPFSHSSSNPNSSNNPLYNLDQTTLWHQHHNQRSDPNYNTPVNLLPSSSNQSHLLRPPQIQRPNLAPSSTATPPGPSSSSVPSLPDNQPTTVKSSRKRTRASRRAPTTVLTTDTANFRQMVQEFTGIPAPPFSATAVSPYSRRFDIFSSALRSSSSAPIETLSPLFSHPFRPSPQKPQPFLTNSITGPASSTTFQINHPSDLGFLSKNPMNPQNNFPLQSLLQDPNSLKYTQATTELGLPHDHVSGNLAVFPGGGVAPTEDQGPHLGSYGGNGNGNGGVGGGGGFNHHHQSSSNNSKVNGSDFNSEKRMENTASQRNGGTVDPWVCPSD